MKQLRKLFAYTLLLTVTMYSCDLLQEDVTPSGDELFAVNTDIRLLEGSPFILDLSQHIQSTEDVKFQIGLQPEKGEIEFFEESFVKFEPSDEFTEGTDQFSIEMYNANEELLDADTITIEILSKEADIPCLNGALADYFEIERDGKVQFNPIINDGYCEDEVDNYELFLLVDPMHGHADKVDGVDFVYEVDSAYVGYDYFLYGLEMVDNAGESHYSAAIVEVQIGDVEDDCRDELFKTEVEFHAEARVGGATYYIYVVDEEVDCVADSWDLEVLEVTYGIAEPYENGKKIIYTAPEDANKDSVGTIAYIATFEDDYSVEGLITVLFKDEENCAEAYDDHYEYIVVSDSLTGAVDPLLVDPAENDAYCNDAYELNILEQPAVGTASINDDKKLVYSFTDEKTENFEITIKYEICNEGKCDYNYIYIDVYVNGGSTENCAEAYNDEYTYRAAEDTITSEGYQFWMDPAANDQYCNESFTLNILQQPSYGSAEVDGQHVVFSMQELPSAYKEVEIKYEICNEGKCDYAWIELGIDVDDPSNTACVEAEDDEYVYNAIPDSTSGEIEPFVFDPIENDEICSTYDAIDITLDILEGPTLGVAEVIENNQIKYTVDEEFAGQKETTMKYKICGGEECDYAYIYLTVNK